MYDIIFIYLAVIFGITTVLGIVLLFVFHKSILVYFKALFSNNKEEKVEIVDIDKKSLDLSSEMLKTYKKQNHEYRKEITRLKRALKLQNDEKY